ncbi:MAG: hypothetical protein ACM3PY_19070 [Omnitrophica WOR_2 bacterium]
MPGDIFEKGSTFIWANARLLERAIYEYRFFQGSPDRVLAILRTYQNEDGGFGHALEPDLRAPDSQPLFVEFALRTLYECRLRDAEMARRLCDFLSAHADLERGIPVIFPSSQGYPRADHWNDPAAIQPSFDRLSSLVGLAAWQGIVHPWLARAVEVCLENMAAAHYDDAHTINNAFCLVESQSGRREVEALRQKLARELFQANFFLIDAPVRQYGLTPLDFAPAPDSYCRKLFTGEQIGAHLDDLADQQDQDGGWPIRWQPPQGSARQEWRAIRTLNALTILRAYGRT